MNSNPISNNKPVHRQEQVGRRGGGDWNPLKFLWQPTSAPHSSSLPVELCSTFSCWERKRRDLSSVCCSGLRCHSSWLSAHLKWMTTAQCVSLCQLPCECLVIGVVTVAAEAGPLKRFFQLWSPAWCLLETASDGDRLSRSLLFGWMFSEWVRVAGSFSSTTAWPLVEFILYPPKKTTTERLTDRETYVFCVI